MNIQKIQSYSQNPSFGSVTINPNVVTSISPENAIKLAHDIEPLEKLSDATNIDFNFGCRELNGDQVIICSATKKSGNPNIFGSDSIACNSLQFNLIKLAQNAMKSLSKSVKLY